MDAVHTEMVAVCDRLLTLLTGKDPLEGDDKDAAHEAIDLLMTLEGWLKMKAGSSLPPLEEEALAQLIHRVRVLDHLKPVIDVLGQQGWLPVLASSAAATFGPAFRVEDVE